MSTYNPIKLQDYRRTIVFPFIFEPYVKYMILIVIMKLNTCIMEAQRAIEILSFGLWPQENDFILPIVG